MPLWENDYLFKFSADGLAHTVQPERTKKPRKGRKDILNQITYDDAYVCLNCTKEECEGERKCFLARKKTMEDKEKNGIEKNI